jgi:hypothetical protein
MAKPLPNYFATIPLTAVTGFVVTCGALSVRICWGD